MRTDFNFDNFTCWIQQEIKLSWMEMYITRDFKSIYKFDMSLNGAEISEWSMRRRRAQQNVFMAKLNLNASIDVTGDLNLPKVTSYLRVNKNTDFYVFFQR